MVKMLPFIRLDYHVKYHVWPPQGNEDSYSYQKVICRNIFLKNNRTNLLKVSWRRASFIPPYGKRYQCNTSENLNPSLEAPWEQLLKGPQRGRHPRNLAPRQRNNLRRIQPLLPTVVTFRAAGTLKRWLGIRPVSNILRQIMMKRHFFHIVKKTS